MKIYFDNAATTPMSIEVIEVMYNAMKNNFGNPSSIHSFGRQARSAIETARKQVAKQLNVSPAEIVFTSGGTEANNMAILGVVNDLNVKTVITSEIEHHAVLFPLRHLEESGKIKILLVNFDLQGHIDLNHLQKLLSENPKSLVSLMHGNNEIGNLLPMKRVSKLCRTYNAWFHCDMVQTMGHYLIDFATIDVDFASCSAHKFHGPKGIGFLYMNLDRIKINPLIRGGAQERNMRAGTENIVGILGLAKAFEIANENIDDNYKKIAGLKNYMVKKLRENITGIEFIGDSEDKGLVTVLNVLFPESPNGEMLIYNLDVDGIAASSGSACSSGSNEKSHVIEALNVDPNRATIRFSFSIYNTFDEIDYCIEKLKKYF